MGKKVKFLIKQINVPLVISIISLVFSGLSLLEVKNSNRIAIMPDIRMEDSYFSLFWDDSGNIIYLGNGSIYDTNIEISDSIRVPGVRFTNLGYGVAKDVRYDWKYEENFKMFQEMLSDEYIIAMEDIGKRWEVSIQFDGEYSVKSVISKYTTASFIKEDGEDYQTFPLEYFRLLGRYCHANFPKSNEIDYSRFLTSDDLPTIKIKVTYSDRMGEKISNDMYIKFSPIQYQFDENGVNKCMLKATTMED